MTPGERGAQGETLAATFLVSKGYVLLEKNLRGRYSEGDLLLEDGETLALVEVKTRQKFEALESITPQKLRRLRRLLALLAARYPNRDIRLDAVTVYWDQVTGEPVINHYSTIL